MPGSRANWRTKMWVDNETFFKIFKEHPDWFTSWVDEGKQIWNRQTGEIVCEDGTLMHDAVYRPPRDYNNYWKDCFQDPPIVINGGPQKYESYLNADYVKDPESLYIKKDRVTFDSIRINSQQKDKKVNPDKFETNQVYKVNPYNKDGIYSKIKFISIDKYCPTVTFDDNYTDDWYIVWGKETEADTFKKVYDNSTLEDCKNFIYDYFCIEEKIND